MSYAIEDVKDCIDHIYSIEPLKYMQELMKETFDAIKNSDKYKERSLLKLIDEKNEELRRWTYDLLLGIEKVGEVIAKYQLDIRLAKKVP